MGLDNSRMQVDRKSWKEQVSSLLLKLNIVYNEMLQKQNKALNQLKPYSLINIIIKLQYCLIACIKQYIMITSLSEDVGRTHRRHNITPLDVAYHQLNQFIQKINDKISNRLQLVQQAYLDDYKQQTQLMRQQLSRLRANLDAQIMLQRSNQKMLLLEEERDFFRAQVLKINTEVNQYLDENKALKKKIADIEVQTANYKAISINQEMKIKKLQKELSQMANFKRQTSAPILPQFKTLQNSLEKEKDEGVKNEVVQSNATSRVNLFERVSVKPAMTLRTKSQSKHESATKASMRRYEQFNGRDQIIDECIKQIKKEIFYRSHDKGFNNSPFQQFGKVQFDKFTRTDKKQLIQALMSNEKILEEFNEFLLNRNSQTTTSRMLRTKVGDDKFNQKFLSDLKKSFSKKIYDLKNNADTVAFSRTAMKKRVGDLE